MITNLPAKRAVLKHYGHMIITHLGADTSDADRNLAVTTVDLLRGIHEDMLRLNGAYTAAREMARKMEEMQVELLELRASVGGKCRRRHVRVAA